MSNPTYHITVIEWGRKDSIVPSLLTVRVGKDPRLVHFCGDAYWQWDASCLRNRGKNACWSQALHDCLEGWHSCVLHTGDTLAILPHHPDYNRVRQLVEDVDNGLAVPTDPRPAPDLW